MTGNSAVDRRTFLEYLGAGAMTSLASCACPGGKAKPARPNILFLVVDDLRCQLGCYGDQQVITPNIDALARGGTVFQRAFCQVPVCGPSRVSVLTSRRTRANQWRCKNLEGPYVTLPAHLRGQGYHTIANGKVLHNQHDRATDWSEAPWRSRPIYHGKGDWAKYNTQGLWQAASSGPLKNQKTGRGPYCEGAPVGDDAYQDGQVATKTIADLTRLKDRDQPFFLACGFWRPHLPFNAPKKYWDLYQRDKIKIAANRFRPQDLPAPCRTSKEIDRYGQTGKRKQDLAFHREARHAYNACVSYVDAQIGRVLGSLDRLGLRDNTIVVLLGDHGWHLGEHDFWGKHNTLHNSLHTPLIVRAPGHKQNNRTRALVELIDIYPTLCDLAAIPLPKPVEGRSFRPLLDDPARPWKQAVFSHWTGCKAVKTDRYLYTEWRKKGKVQHRMLFDHLVDPEENINLAGREERRELVNTLSRKLSKL